MSHKRQVARRFSLWLLINVLFIAATLLFLKPREIPFDREAAFSLFEILLMGSVFALILIHYCVKLSDELFSRRMAASAIITQLIFFKFDHFIAGHQFGIENQILSGMLMFWATMIAVNVALQALHRLSPSTIR